MRELSPTWQRAAIAAAVTAAFTGLAGTASAATGGTAGPGQVPAVTCTSESLPVTLTAGAGTVMTGQLCSRGAPAGKPLIVAVPGGTYDHNYWNWPGSPAHYSFTWAATLAGYTVLVLPGAGHSINLATNAPLAFVQELGWALRLTGPGHAGRQWAAVAARWTAQYAQQHAARR